MTADLATTALQRAIALRQPPPDCVHHAGRGSQYCSEDYRKLLSTHGFIVSMSKKGKLLGQCGHGKLLQDRES